MKVNPNDLLYNNYIIYLYAYCLYISLRYRVSALFFDITSIIIDDTIHNIIKIIEIIIIVEDI